MNHRPKPSVNILPLALLAWIVLVFGVAGLWGMMHG